MVATLVTWFSLFGLGCTTKEAPKSEQEMIILVSIDTLRADHLSSYGYERRTSPFIDSLAEKGVRFSYARSASPWTLPAHVTMLTGQLPMTHKVVDDGVSLDPKTPILPELLQKKGWGTGGFVSTMYVSSLFGFDRGFEHFEDFDLLSEKKNLSGSIDAENVIDEALDWFSGQSGEKPLFLFLHFYDAHYAYDAPSPYDEKFDRPSQKGDLKYRNYFHFKKKKNKVEEKQKEHQIAQYDEEILYVDAQLKRLSDVLSSKRPNIKWVITSDHGEEFWERGTWGHAHTLYSEQLHVPLIISGADIPTSVPDSGWVGSHDIAPTIGAWAGIDGLKADGQNLESYFSGKKSIPERTFMAETTRFKTNRLSILEGEYRLEWDLKNKQTELFHTLNDLKEESDISDENPEIVKALKLLAEKELGAPWTAQEDGFVWLKKAVALKNGQKRRKMPVMEGDTFQILPYDAPISFSKLQSPETKIGMWQQVGAKNNASLKGLKIEQNSSNKEVHLDENAKRMLEQIGYIQDDSEE